MDPRDRIRLQHMLDAARDALSFAQGRSRADLDTDRQFVLATVKAIEIIGEAANNVGLETRRELPVIPWPAIINMRHRLVHGYFQINLSIVWQTLVEDLAPLIAQLEQALGPEAGEGRGPQNGA